MQPSARRCAIALVLALLAVPLQASERLLIATAANFKPAMEELVAHYREQHPEVAAEPVYASTGKLAAQIRAGAPFDLFFAADMATPQALARDGLNATPVRACARGRLVIWSAAADAASMRLKDLADPRVKRIAIANPRHAPYGARAEEALRAARVWDAVVSRLVYGENIGQAAQFVASGNAPVGLIALSQALDPALAQRGGYALVPQTLHTPIDQGCMVTRRAADRPAAMAFMALLASGTGQRILKHHGYAVSATPRPQPPATQPPAAQ